MRWRAARITGSKLQDGRDIFQTELRANRYFGLGPMFSDQKQQRGAGEPSDYRAVGGSRLSNVFRRSFPQNREKIEGGFRRGHFSFADDFLGADVSSVQGFVGSVVRAQSRTFKRD